MIVATDGSSTKSREYAGWGVCVKEVSEGTMHCFDAPVRGADQSSLAAEAEAVEQVLAANAEPRKNIHLFIDNMVVVQLLKKMSRREICLQYQSTLSDGG